ncbi:DDB1- and CUL4-associated factor 11-like isoform X1 [Macrosteles quadrilineatus]|uniref:DDB1- and CUL4-associated factor 11-like isoform X1 n=1 Tax=Macrosteles quadrilineatus TaxID=74068 RepID=UPI0023E3343B|nr:DDB1- and CUL4-associated factor 11-like isoform X1 [Macrosteles quadrilineatus]XP_054275341.1 DDB1- and CUL4-associated factor 11-like isoform X1 [Macrosteles quadrilineatus]
MGSSASRRMEERSEDSAESDLAAILQYLIRSGQVHIISSDHDNDSDEDFVAAASPPQIDHVPNTKNLQMSEITLITKQACGLLHSKGRKRPKSTTSMVMAREAGIFGDRAFSRGDKCRIGNTLLPRTTISSVQHNNKMFCGIYSKDGDKFLTASQDRYIRLYQTKCEGLKFSSQIQARDVGWSIVDTTFSPDGRWIVYSSWSESLHLCRISDPENHEALPLNPEDRRFCIFSTVFSSDGTEILGGANDGYLYVYDLECNQRTLRIDGHGEDVNTVAFADSTSKILYSGGDDGLVKVWDRRTLNETNPRPVGVLAGHMDGITYIDSKGDSRYLLSNSKDQSIKLWDVRVFSSEDAQEFTRKVVSEQNWDYRWQKAPKKLINPKDNLEGDTSVMTYRGHSVLQTLIRCHFSPSHTTGQRFIYTGCASGRVVIYDLLTGEIVKVLKGHRGCVRDVSWHPYRPELASTSWDYSVVVWGYKHKDRDDSDDQFEEVEPTPQKVRRSSRIAEMHRRNLQQIL